MQLKVSLQDARTKIATEHKDHADVVMAYYDGDHWQGGKGWIGPFSEQIALGNATAAALVKAGFVSRDVVKEGIDRHIEGVVGREPAWYATVRRAVTDEAPITEAEQALIAEMESALVEWWDNRNGLDVFQNAALSLVAKERAVLRLFVPRGLRVDNGAGQFLVPALESGTPAEKLSQALEFLFPAVVDLDSAGVFTDLDTMSKYGLHLSTRATQIITQEEISRPKDILELSYLDGVETVMEVTGDTEALDPEAIPSAGKPQTVAYRFNWDKHLPLYQMTRKPLVTTSAVSQQKGMNLLETMKHRNIVSAGSPERWLFNADPPGTWIDDPDNPGKKKFIPQPFQIGGGVTNVVSGITVEETDGTGLTRRTITTPHLQRLDPASSELFTTGEEGTYANMLSELKQRHVLMGGDGSASAVSRVQARADYLNSLLITKTEIDGALRWILETAVAMAAFFAGLEGRYSELRIYAAAKLDTGPLTPEERREILEEYKAGALSKETTMHLLGVEDVDAEIARIEAEEEKSLVVQQARADIVATLVQKAGSSLKGAMLIAGYETKEITAALKKEEPAALPPALAAAAGIPVNGQQQGEGNGDGNGQGPDQGQQQEEEGEENEEEQA